MKSLLLVTLMALTSNAFAHQDELDEIDAILKKGDVVVIFKSDGSIDGVTCDTKTYSNESCISIGNRIFEYYTTHVEKH